MSQDTRSTDNQLANVAGVALSLAIVLIFALVPARSNAVVATPTVPATQAVAQVIPTDTPLPTATLPPPTVTPPPTATPTDPPTQTPEPTATPLPSDTPLPPATAAVPAAVAEPPASASSYAPELVAQGESLFIQCAACHGADARGLPNLGKDLVDSEFVAAQTDDALVQFITTGRPIWDPENTTGLDMPGKGGNPVLTTEDIEAIVAYLRTLSAEDDGAAAAAPVSNEAAAYDPAVIAEGEQHFVLCAACHGADGRGIPNLGKDLVASEFVDGLTDVALLEFIKTGRPIWDPENTTGLDMPGKGGNPALTDEQILTIIAYLRSLPAGSE
jgi:cbb3-type cytochrome c oxidase subunit III